LSETVFVSLLASKESNYFRPEGVGGNEKCSYRAKALSCVFAIRLAASMISPA
jgi:hypothetical protein